MRNCEACNVRAEHIRQLEEMLKWYRDENRSLLNRLMITAKVPPIMRGEDEPAEEPEPEPEPAGDVYGGL